MAADATTAMTIDFLRARLLSERSVSRAAKERADQLARRVAELEEQLLAVTARRRKAERAAAEVLTILDSQGFGLLSDATDGSGSDGEADAGVPGAAETVRGGGNARGDAPEDALSGSELGGQASAAQAGGLSWKGRAAGQEWERRRPLPPQQMGRQLRQRQGHSQRRGYFYRRAADSSPKYHPGQSCRKIKRKELRSQRVSKENIAGESAEEGQERSDCTVCTDEQPDLDAEVSQNGRDFSNTGGEDGSDRYHMDCGKNGEMERVLEKQAELIGQYQAEENAQREWEKKFSMSCDSTVDTVNLCNKQNQMENACGKRESAHIIDKEVSGKQARSSKNNHFGINKLSEYLPEGSVSGLLPDAATYCAIEECKVDNSDQDFGKAIATVASSGGELQVDVLATKSYLETVEGTSNSLETSTPSPQESCDSSLNAGQNSVQRDGNPDNGSSYNVNAPSSECYINTLSVGSRSCDTPKSEFSEWSSSCFHNHIDDQLDTQLYQSACNDVGSVLEALRRAKISLTEKLSRPGLPSQNLLALPPPEDQYTKDDLPVTEMQLSLSRSSPLSQEILELQAPAYYLNRITPQGDTKVPVCQAGLFRVPTDSFPANWMASSDGYGSRFSLTGTTQLDTSPIYTVNHIRSTSPLSQYGSGCYPHDSMLLPMPTAGGCRIPESDLRTEDALFLSEVPRPRNNLRKMLSEDALMRFQYALE